MQRKNSRIPGFSYSWKRAIGISGVRQRVARKVGIPTTKAGLERKIGTVIIRAILSLFGIR